MPGGAANLGFTNNLGGSTKTGATPEQTSIGNSQTSFMDTLQKDFGTAFAGQQNILNGLTKSLQTTLAGGPGQYGFSTPETTALNTLATTGNASQYQNARAAAGEAAAAAGGGGALLPTGANAANQATIASNAATNQSNSLLGIQEAGYKQGNQNYNESVSGLSNVAQLENPNALAGSANQAGEQAASTAAQIQKENAASSPWSMVGGLVGSLASAGLAAATGGASAAIPALTGAAGTLGKAVGASNQQGLDTISPTSNSLDNYQIPFEDIQNF